MKNVLIVLAHPEPKSMNGLLKNKAVDVLTKSGHQVEVRDLYALNFPIEGKDDNPMFSGDFFDLQQAQSEAQQFNRIPEFIKVEQDKLSWADLVIFQFPLWWYSVPAILKSYIDSTFSVGFAYSGNFALEGKEYMLSFTTGAPEFLWTEDKKGTIDQLLFHIDIGVFQMLRMIKLPPFIGYGSKRLSEAQRENLVDDFGNHLFKILA